MATPAQYRPAARRSGPTATQERLAEDEPMPMPDQPLGGEGAPSRYGRNAA